MADTSAKPSYNIAVKGMDCSNCALKIERGVRGIAGVDDVKVNFMASSMTVAGDGVDLNKVIRTVNALGYRANPVTDASPSSPTTIDEIASFPVRQAAPVAVGAVLAVAAWAAELFSPDLILPKLFAVGAVLIAGIPVYRRAWAAVRSLSLDIHFLMTVAVIAAFAIGEWLEGSVIIVLFALSELLENASVSRSRRALTALVKMRPRTALRLNNRAVEEVPAEALSLGDLVLVKPGGVIPVDGVIRAGKSWVDQAAITGESMPIPAEPGGRALAGSINGEGSLEIEVRRVSGDTTFDRIIQLIRQAQAEKAPAQRFIEKFAAWYTPAVVGGALMVALLPPLLFGQSWNEWIYRALAMLVISCPCALVISTPVTIVSAIAGAARRGILIKGGEHLEQIARIRAVALDKTGTVTGGKPVVHQIHPLNGVAALELLQIAASIESDSEHPVARAIVQRAREESVSFERAAGFASLPGRGACAEVGGETFYTGNHSLFEELGICDASVHSRLEHIEDAGHTAVMVGSPKKIYGIFAVGDQVREPAKNVVNSLHRMGIVHIALLTGDNHRTGQGVGAAIGADEVRSELLPEQKVVAIRELKDKWGAVMMVGDGVNDAPALALADVGVAMGGAGIDAALQTADVVLASDKLELLPVLFRIARKSARLIRGNIALAIGIKALFLALAAGGLATLWMAVMADMGVTLLVVFNGMRALRVRDG